MARKRSTKNVNVDLSGVESSRKAIPEGQYVVSVNDASIENSSKGNDYIKFEFEVIEGGHKGAKLYHNCSLQPQALFNLKNVLEALGFSIPKKAFDLDLGDLLGMECEVEVGHETYEGKKRARILEFINPSESDEEDDEDEEDEEESLEDALSNLSKKNLKALAKEFEVEIERGATEDDIIDALLEEVDEEDLQEAIEELS